MSREIENEFDPGTLHRLIEFRDRQKGKRLSIRASSYTIKMILTDVQKRFNTPDLKKGLYA